MFEQHWAVRADYARDGLARVQHAVVCFAIPEADGFDRMTAVRRATAEVCDLFRSQLTLPADAAVVAVPLPLLGHGGIHSFGEAVPARAAAELRRQLDEAYDAGLAFRPGLTMGD
jgi:hypothetical protein